MTLAVTACSAATRRPGRVTVTSPGDVGPRTRTGASSRVVRIALARGVAEARLESDEAWGIHAGDGSPSSEMVGARQPWTVEARDGMVVVRRPDGSPARREDSAILARPEGAGLLSLAGRRWRGDIRISADDAGRLLVVNHVPMDDYLKGVVPLEIGTRAMADFAAAEAQSVAARSYAYMHLVGPGRAYDMLATVADQVYGGVDAETPLGNQSVDNTSGLVLMYQGRVVNAPYSGNCGGFTAEPGDAWRSGPEPYLQRVSDRIPGSDRFYCEAGPRFRWTRRYTAEELRQSIVRFLRTLPRGPASIASVRGVTVTEVTPAGRVAALTVDTDRGRWTLRGNDIRAALRTTSGEMLYSTYFSVDAVEARGTVQTLELRGGGNGHGIGMCQSGAIGRARAGQDFRTILTTYYPGTTIGTID